MQSRKRLTEGEMQSSKLPPLHVTEVPLTGAGWGGGGWAKNAEATELNVCSSRHLSEDFRLLARTVYLQSSSCLSHLPRNLQSFPGGSWPPAAPRRQQGPVEERCSCEPFPPALWAGTLIPRRSWGRLRSHGNPRRHSPHLTFDT